MLEIKNIKKTYVTGGFKQIALGGVSINFRKSEFASILGPSGSGKTTLLNIIGGLDHYDSGDLIINEVSTKKYKDANWDSYRNHRIGFVFQNYNLITHQTILANVKLALTLSGISKKEATERAKKALKDVGLEKHLNKKPNQMSGGQMQRVAIARALVNDPDILLADEPTGALDSETSIQIMELLKKIAKDKLVIMVTHNPELAQKYSSRIVTLKDGKIISDSNPYNGKEDTSDLYNSDNKSKKTKMHFKTALGLSFNNLLTKKGRTILVALAGSIGIIGIALIMAVSNGFQAYVDNIQEETLTSYPLTIMQEATDISSLLLSMTTSGGDNDGTNKVVEQQYITSMLSSVSANDLASLKKYIELNYNDIKEDIANIEYKYSVDPNIYTIDATKKVTQLNPNNMFSSMMGGTSSLLSSYSSFSSVYNQMVDNIDEIKKDYDVLAGTWPTKYNEMIIVLSEPNTISDLLVYSLGFKDTEELTKMITNIMSGKGVDTKSDPLTLTYDDLLNLDLRLVMPSDTYKYNSKYKVYEDMSKNESYMKDVYNKAEKLKIVGIVTKKSGTTTTSLTPGVVYQSSLIKHIIDTSKNTDIVKKQMTNSEIDVFSGQKFDETKNQYDFKFEDLVTVDSKKMEEAFNIKIDAAALQKEVQEYMTQISNSISVDTTKANELFVNNLNTIINSFFNKNKSIKVSSSNEVVDNFMKSNEVKQLLIDTEKEYVIPSDSLNMVYTGILKSIVDLYINTNKTMNLSINSSFEYDENSIVEINDTLKDTLVSQVVNSAAIKATTDTMAKSMTEAKMKKEVLTKVGQLTTNLSNKMANAFDIDPSKIASAFKLNFTEDELTRVVSAMMNDSKATPESNLISLGYQDEDKPTYISFYFTSFEGKEHFIDFLHDYNSKVEESKEINFSDTTGILMSSVKTIVNAVSYVLIAFVSISLVVSSIMIGVITYISVYERTKEIGILRAIGASKHNISSIFNAETFIIGLLSGIFGIGISYGLIPIINLILHHYTGNIPLNAILPIFSALKLVVLSIILTLFGGIIPSQKASKKDPVEALRSE